MFADKATIRIKAGDGGDGAVSFYREKYVAAGGPDGGNGGKGGDVIFIADTSQSSLINFRYKKKYKAQNGENGRGKRASGKSAKDLIIKVPKGTTIKNADTGRIIADISDDLPHIIAHGGRGGKGNMNFASSTRQIPKFAKPGYPGEEMLVTLELNLLADVGLVGFPSVGKSSIISKVSAAKPQIAAYHFTTLTPVLGVVKVNDDFSFVMADIPGLIEGASNGAGLGHEFLRHIERCRLIVHVCDVSGMEGRDPKEDFEIINHELKKFDEDLASRPQIVCANKADIASPEQIADFKNFIEGKGIPFFAVSAASGDGLTELMNKVAEEVSKLPPVTPFEPQPLTPQEVAEDEKKNPDFVITKEDGIYIVESKKMEPVFRSINLDDYSSLTYFQKILRSSGIISELEKMGVQEGDTVSILGFEFEYIK